MVIGIAVGIALFGTITSATAQTCQESKGEKSEISVRSSTRRYTRNAEEKIASELKHENLIRLDEKAKMICSGTAYCIDESSVRNEVDVVDSFVSLINVRSSAVLNCLK